MAIQKRSPSRVRAALKFWDPDYAYDESDVWAKLPVIVVFCHSVSFSVVYLLHTVGLL